MGNKIGYAIASFICLFLTKDQQIRLGDWFFEKSKEWAQKAR